MKHTEEELQNQIEKGLNSNSKDGNAYQRVFEVLKKEPDFHVSLPFADRLVAIIEKKEEKRAYAWMAIGIFFTVLVLAITLAISSMQWSTGAFTFLYSHAGLVLFGIGFILMLQWVDKKVVKNRVGFR